MGMPKINRPETALRRVLREQGRMQSWLAAQVGCTASDISDYARGVHIPAEPRRSQIACALGVTLADLGWAESAEKAA